MDLLFEIPGIAPSVNKAYATNWKTKRRFATKDLSDWYLLVARHISCIAPKGRLSVEYEFHKSWYTQNGSIRKADCDNLLKCSNDAVFKALGIDDSLVWSLSCKKVDALTEKTVVKIYSLYQS